MPENSGSYNCVLLGKNELLLKILWRSILFTSCSLKPQILIVIKSISSKTKKKTSKANGHVEKYTP